ncbi:MAG: hypothetical protein AAFQ82_12855, partial [Myxococcota bacterium]
RTLELVTLDGRTHRVRALINLGIFDGSSQSPWLAVSVRNMNGTSKRTPLMVDAPPARWM